MKLADLTPEEIKQVIHDFVNTMSSQQYKGARYVPIVGRLGEESAEWDNTAPYEPLTIVLHEGNSYTSRQYVPAGVALTNGEYWAMTGEFNGQVAQLRALVNRYQAQIDANTQAILDEVQARHDADVELADKIDANADAIEELSGSLADEVEARQEADGDLSDRISTLSGNLQSEEDARILADRNLERLIDENEASTILRFGEDRARISANELGIAALDKVAKNETIGGTVTPAYQGSFMADEQNASCLFVDPYIYTFSVNNYDNTGTVRVFDRTANALHTTYSNVQLGHGNSAAYDGTHIYVLPLNTYSGGVSSRSNKLYVFDTSMGDRREWTLPTDYPYAVSYDPKNGILYYVDAQNSVPTIKLYSYDAFEQQWNLVFSLTDSQFTAIAGSDVYWQDFAVLGTTLIGSKLDGTSYIITFDPEENEGEIVGTFRIAHNSAGGMWKMGEIEGIEFDEYGRLWNMRTFDCGFRNEGESYNHSIGFVTTLNTIDNAMIDEGVQFKPYGTLDIVASTKFKLNRYELHSINECLCRLDDFAVVRVSYGVSYSDVRVRTLRDVCIRVEGTMTISDTIEVDAGHMFLYVSVDSDSHEGIVNFTGEDVACISSSSRACQVSLRNRGTINIAAGVNTFLQCGYAPTLFAINGLGNLSEITVNGSVSVTAVGLLMGNYKVYGGGA